MKLNHQNYYTSANKNISNSKMGDFLRDPYYFYEKHIEGSLEKSVTPSMMIGSGVDCILTESWEDFDKKFQVATPKEDLPEGVSRITKGQYETITKIALSVEKLDAYKDIKDFDSQEILHVEFPDFGIWNGICGIPDWIHIDGHKCIIVDLKTSKTIDERKFHFHALEYGYYRQQAFYNMMVTLLHPEVTEFENRLIVVENNGLHRSAVFTMDQEYLEDCSEDIASTIQSIVETKVYKPQNLTWSDAFVLPFGE